MRSATITHNTRTSVVFSLALVLAILTLLFIPSTATAQTWPTSWRPLDTDANEPGGANHRDVVEANWSCDAANEYLFLRLRTVDPPTFSAGPARYKWFIDVGLGLNLYTSGGNELGADWLLFVEDSDGNGTGEIYLLDAQGNDRFTQYEPWNSTSIAPITDPSIAHYNITGNYIDMWVAFSAIGVT